MKYVHKQKKERLYNNFVKSAMQYEQNANEIGVECVVAREDLTKPDSHGMLELHRVSIPLHGHASYIPDMNLEASHQPINASHMKHTHCNARTTAVFNTFC